MDFCRRNSGVFGVRVGSTKPDDAITDFEGVMFSRTCRDYGPFCLITAPIISVYCQSTLLTRRVIDYVSI
jgi:hypothetical protein